MEQQVTFEAGDITLEGRLWSPEQPATVGAVLCHPHPLYGGNMSNNVVSGLTKVLQQAGIMTLRFNFRGVGGSGGTHGEGKAELQDVQAAVSCLLSHQAVPNVVIAGYSFGSMVGLQAGATDARVHALIGVALPVGRRNADFLPSAQKATLLISGDRDEIAPLPKLQALIDTLPEPKQLVTIAGADHFFWSHEGEVAEAVLDFIRRHFT